MNVKEYNCLCCEEKKVLAYCFDCMQNEVRLHWKYRNRFNKEINQ